MIITQLQDNWSSNQNEICDLHYKISYQQLPQILTQIDIIFTKNCNDKSSFIYFECGNSLLDLLFILYLFWKKQNFILSSVLKKEQSVIPSFCQYQVFIKDNYNIEIPETYFSVKKSGFYTENKDQKVSEKFCLSTSGSTGITKMVQHCHHKFIKNAKNCVDFYHLTSSDRVVIPIPIFHMYGLGAALIPSILAGASINIQENPNILSYLEQESKWQPNVAFLTPILCKMLLFGRRKKTEPYRAIITAGDKIQEDLFCKVDKKLGRLINQYGSTEMGALAASVFNDNIDTRSTHTGKPMSGVKVKIENLNEDGIGELHCDHSYGFEGYVSNNGIFTEQNSWYKTGDLAKIKDNGYIKVLGRYDNSVNRNGFLVIFSDIEKTMATISNIEQVVILRLKGETKFGDKIGAFCQCAENSISREQIYSNCHKILARHMIPDEIFILSSLPMLSSGKIDRQKLISYHLAKKN